MKFLLQNNCVGFHVTRLSVMLKVFLHHLVRYVARTLNTVRYRPKVTPPIPFRKFRILFLKSSRCPPLQSLNNITDIQRWTIFNVDMYVVFTYYSLQYLHILSIRYLLNKIAASLLDVSLQNFIPTFFNPNYVHSKPRYCVATDTKFFAHLAKLLFV